SGTRMRSPVQRPRLLNWRRQCPHGATSKKANRSGPWTLDRLWYRICPSGTAGPTFAQQKAPQGSTAILAVCDSIARSVSATHRRDAYATLLSAPPCTPRLIPAAYLSGFRGGG